MVKKETIQIPGLNRLEKTSSFLGFFNWFFISLVLLFALHRGLSFGILASEVPPETKTASYLVGSLSDIWAAFLLAIIFSLPTFATSRVNDTCTVVLKIFLINLSAIGLAAHQGYIEFFQFQLEPFHLKYLTDPQFMASNAGSFFSNSNILMLGAGLTLSLAPISRFRVSGKEPKALLLFSAIALSGLLAHNRNIHLRVQWFVPENLQTNVLETVYIRSKRPHAINRLNQQNFNKARSFYTNEIPVSTPPTGYDQTIFSGSYQLTQSLHPLGLAIQNVFQEKIRTEAKPSVIVVLLESLRPSETGLFVKDRPSLTNNLDRLAANGVWFSNAFSSGSVTRAGQEAAFCGNFSGRNSSLMRNYPTLKYNCLTDELAKTRAELFWYHGGDGRFDGQEQFWRRHQISEIKTITAYPKESVKTGWGIGDKAFFGFAANDHAIRRQHYQYPFALGMMLSVTNHIPWDLPEDFSGPTIADLPAYLTTAYTDQALGILEKSLKNTGIWDSTLLIIASDHGNKTEPYGALYQDKKNRMQSLQAHINLIISGGIAEAAKASMPNPTKTRFDHYVSQTDIAATIARIIAHADFKSMGKDLFDESSGFPVLSQTEDGLYLPAEDALLTYDEAAAALTDQDQEHWQARFHYQAMLQYLNDRLTDSR